MSHYKVRKINYQFIQIIYFTLSHFFFFRSQMDLLILGCFFLMSWAMRKLKSFTDSFLDLK